LSATEIISLAGAIAGVIALAGLIYTLGFKLGRIETQVQLLWKVTVEDALRKQSQAGNIERGSRWIWKDEASTTLVPEVEAALQRLSARRAGVRGDEAQVVALVIHGLGYNELRSYAEDANVAFAEYLVLCAVRIIQMANSGGP